MNVDNQRVKSEFGKDFHNLHISSKSIRKKRKRKLKKERNIEVANSVSLTSPACGNEASEVFLPSSFSVDSTEIEVGNELHSVPYPRKVKQKRKLNQQNQGTFSPGIEFEDNTRSGIEDDEREQMNSHAHSTPNSSDVEFCNEDNNNKSFMKIRSCKVKEEGALLNENSDLYQPVKKKRKEKQLQMGNLAEKDESENNIQYNHANDASNCTSIEKESEEFFENVSADETPRTKKNKKKKSSNVFMKEKEIEFSEIASAIDKSPKRKKVTNKCIHDLSESLVTAGSLDISRNGKENVNEISHSCNEFHNRESTPTATLENNLSLSTNVKDKTRKIENNSEHPKGKKKKKCAQDSAESIDESSSIDIIIPSIKENVNEISQFLNEFHNQESTSTATLENNLSSTHNIKDSMRRNKNNSECFVSTPRNVTIMQNQESSVSTCNLDFSNKWSPIFISPKRKRKSQTSSANSNFNGITIDNGTCLSSSMPSSSDMYVTIPRKKSISKHSESNQGITSDVFETAEMYEELVQDAMLTKQDSKKILQDLCIVLNHDVPLLHSVGIRLCSLPKKEDRTTLIALGMKKGPFNKSEDAILMANWEKFRKEYNISDHSMFTDMRRTRNPEQKREFLQFLGNGLPNRALHQIYRRFLLLSCRKGPFTAAEDQIILKTMHRKISDPYCVLAQVLKRSRHAIYQRYKVLCEKMPDEKEETLNVTLGDSLHWTKDLAESVVKALLKATQAKSMDEFKNVRISSKTWREVEKEVHVVYRKLRLFWNYKLHVQLFAESPVCENKVFRKIIKWLRKNPVPTEKEIQWAESVHLVPGSTSTFMWQMFRKLRRNYDAAKFPSLTDFINLLYEERRALGDKNKYLTRYKINEDFSLSIIKDD